MLYTIKGMSTQGFVKVAHNSFIVFIIRLTDYIIVNKTNFEKSFKANC